ncbi:MAG: hypothetical protein PVF43_16085 [Candidatus Eiseniibacteriota bacterium]|jgi:hypothetical protein
MRSLIGPPSLALCLLFTAAGAAMAGPVTARPALGDQAQWVLGADSRDVPAGSSSREPAAVLSIGVAGGWSRIGYQEHLDPTGEDTLLTRCRGTGRDDLCKIESDAALHNLRFDLRARADLREGLLIGSALRTELLRGTDREFWTQTSTDPATGGRVDSLQTDDLEYRWTHFDLYGGYRIRPLLRPIVGLRISRVEQRRDAFIDEIVDVALAGSAIEPVRSTWLLLGALGEQSGPGRTFGYHVIAGLPLSVKTTNSALPGAEFTGVGGYLFEASGSLSLPLGSRIRFVLGVQGGVMHWNGSDLVRVRLADGRQYIAKWPENDTRQLAVLGGLELGSRPFTAR